MWRKKGFSRNMELSKILNKAVLAVPFFNENSSSQAAVIWISNIDIGKWVSIINEIKLLKVSSGMAGCRDELNFTSNI